MVIDGFDALRNACVFSQQERCSTWKAANAAATHTGASSGPWPEEGVWGTKNQGAASFLYNSRGSVLPSLQQVGERLRLVAMHRVVKESVDFRDQAIDG